MAKPTKTQLVIVEPIGNSIHVVRGQSVLLDVDLAALYGVETKVLLQAVKRNLERTFRTPSPNTASQCFRRC